MALSYLFVPRPAQVFDSYEVKVADNHSPEESDSEPDDPPDDEPDDNI